MLLRTPAAGECELRKKSLTRVASIAAVMLIAIATILWRHEQASVPPPPPPPPPVATSTVPAPPEATAVEPVVRHPIETSLDNQQATAAPDSDAALAQLFGHKAWLSLFQAPDFARRLVATVDNLGRSHAPVTVWPVDPTPGRLVVAKRQGAQVLGADNGLRYSPFVLLVEAVNLGDAVAAYVRFYPQFQKAYEDLGFPRRYFNDRLVDVIDLLLATPEVGHPLKVRLPRINGPLQPERPWVLYQFEDPALQSLASGQKILLRMGPVNERRMKAKLLEIRGLVTAVGLPR